MPVRVLLALLSLAVGWHTARCQDPAPPDGVAVQARGPVHEAFAESLNGLPQATALVAKQPPDPIEEMPPEQKPEGDNVQWIPGYWAWDEGRNDYLWVSGFWRVPPPGREWTPGHWKQADSSWQWAPGFWSQQNVKEVSYVPPPPASLETATPAVPAPGADYVYVQGCWIYRDGRYIWRPGYWAACQPGWIWVPAHYTWTPCGYVYVEGYWDYPLHQRGLLFAPVVIEARVCRPGFVYCPCYVVQSDVLVGAMFVRPGVTCYYYGDYFEPRYRDAGFVAFVDVRIGGGYDPLFGYYRWENRGRPGWEVEIRTRYVGIYNGTIARPGPNFVVHIDRVNRDVVKLRKIDAAERMAARQEAHRMVEASHERARAEHEMLAKGGPPKLNEPPRTAAKPATAKPASAAAAHPASNTNVPQHPGTPAASHAATPNTPAKPAQAGQAQPQHQPANAHGSGSGQQHPASHPAQGSHPGTTPQQGAHPSTTPQQGSHPGTTPAQGGQPQGGQQPQGSQPQGGQPQGGQSQGGGQPKQ